MSRPRIVKAAVAALALVIGLTGAWAAKPKAASPIKGAFHLVSVTAYHGKPADDVDVGGRTPERGVELTFDRPVKLDDVRHAFVVMPHVRLRWDVAGQPQNYRVRIPGSLKKGTRYTLVGIKAVKDGSGAQTLPARSTTFEFTGREPAVDFVRLGRVLERTGRQLVHLSVVNVPTVRLSTVRLPFAAVAQGPSILVTSSADLGALADELGRQDADFASALKSHSGPFAGLFGRSFKPESEVFSEPGPEDKAHRASLPLAWRKDPPGVVLLRAENGVSGDATAASVKAATEILTIGDLSLSYKVGSDGITVWTTKLSTGAPVSGAKVFVATKKGLLLSAGATDVSGLVRLKADASLPSLELGSRSAAVGSTPFNATEAARIVAVDGDDVAYAAPSDHTIPLPPRVASAASQDSAPVRAHVFTERGIYRPGDTVRFKATLRRFEDGKAVAPTEEDGSGTPVKLVFEDARESVVSEQTLKVGRFGTVAGTLAVRATAALGQWTLKVKPAKGDEMWTSTTFRVEEFVAPRHKVDVSFEAKDVAGAKVGEATKMVVAQVRGLYYAGGGLKHGKVRWKAFLKGTRHDLAKPAGFVAGTEIPSEPDLLEAGESILDETGGLAIDVPLSADVLDGRRALEIVATALDFDGRAATGTGSYTVTPDVLVGIGAPAGEVDQGEPVELPVVAVDRASGQPVGSGALDVEVLHETWTSVQKRNADGDFFWSWEPLMLRSQGLESKLVDGKGTVALQFSRGGKHQVKVTYKTPEGKSYSSTATLTVSYGYGDDGDGSDEAWQAERLRKAVVHTDRPEYVPGETAKLSWRMHREPAALLFSVEREGVREVKMLAVTPGQNTVELPITEDMAPNVYVSILGTHPRSGFPVYATEPDTGAPGYSFGCVNIPVRPAHGGLKVSLAGCGETVKLQPRDRASIEVTVTDRDGKPAEAEVALAVIDESVLALTGYTNPVLDELFRVILPLAVRTGDLRRVLTVQSPYKALTVRPLTGGDGGDAKSRTREWFDPVAFFQPDLVTDASGRAKVEFTVPDTMTNYRVYALAVDTGQRHGGAHSSITVVKPFYLEPGLPRFFTEGDQGKFTVAFFNSTGADGSVELKITGSDLLTLDAPTAASAVANGARGEVRVGFKAVKVGVAELTLEAKLGSHTDAVKQSIPVRSRWVARTQSITADAGNGDSEASLDLPAEVTQLPPEARSQITARIELSRLETTKLLGGIKYLLAYPHGCIEQTSSGVLPLAALRSLAQAGQVPGLDVDTIDKFLAAGIDRLMAMQVGGGGFGYWPGYSQPHPWGSAYATLALTVAKEAGATVPSAEMGRALEYLEAVAKGTGDESRTARAVSMYVLARNGRPRQDSLALLKNTPRPTVEDSLLAIAAAARWGRVEEARKELATLVKAPVPTEDSYSEWSWGSHTRALAIQLIALTEIAPTHPQRAKVALKLLGQVKPHGSWNSTHDTGWSVTALAHYLDRRNTGTGPIEVKVAGAGAEQAVSVAAQGTEVVTLDAAAFLAAPKVTLTRVGSEPLFYRLETTYPYRGPDVSNENAAVKREFKRLAGDGPIKVGDLVEVSIEFKTGTQHYTALVDPLPAGLVAINSQLATEEQVVPKTENTWNPGEDWVHTFNPAHIELRNDHVKAFQDYTWRGKQRFTYVARAVLEGTFVVPPARFEPMYEPEAAIYSPEAVLTIQPATAK